MGSLPLECTSQILSFLPLQDCLSFAACSTASMKDVFPSLVRRRNRLTARSAYSTKLRQFTSLAPRDFDIHGGDWQPIPSVQEQVEDLAHQVPRSHTSTGRIYQLRDSLRQPLDENLSKHTTSFDEIFRSMKDGVLAHKLHAAILRDTMSSDPLEASSSVSVDQYLGDVLCLTYLFNQSNLGLIEGGPTSANLKPDLRGTHRVSSCYRSWVYLHSSILRVKTFSEPQRQRLGVSELPNILSELIPNDFCINEFFLSSEMTLVYSDFGPLGSTFRQRDIVRVRDIGARRLFCLLMTNDSTGETRGTLEWLCLIHEQARKVRPMTVRPPLLRLCFP